MGTLLQDLRYAARLLLKNPGFAMVAVFTLALGIGANTAIFSVIEAVLIRPLPYKDPSNLVVVADRQDPRSGGFLYKDFANYKSQNHCFANLAIYYRDSGFARVTLTAASEPESVQGAFVSADFFATLGVPPLLGRGFSSEEEQREEHVLLLSHSLWFRRFGGVSDAIGKTLQVNGEEWKIVGVMPATFHFPEKDEQFWAPITTNPYWHDPALTTKIDPRNTHAFFGRWIAVGRLRNSVTVKQAQTEADSLLAEMALADPDQNRVTLGVLPGRRKSPAQHASRSVCLAQRGVLRAADRLQQCRKPGPRARGGTRSRNGCAGCAWSGAHAVGTATIH
jgi:hypothetical protein